MYIVHNVLYSEHNVLYSVQCTPPAYYTGFKIGIKHCRGTFLLHEQELLLKYMQLNYFIHP